MALTAHAHELVTPAFAGPITDKLLERAIGVARAAQDGRLTEDDGTLFLLVAAPIMEECLQWRRRMALIRDVACPDNLVMFPGVGA